MSQATHVGRETELKDAGGRVWHTARWTRAVWTDLLEWARPRIPDPFTVAEKAMARFPAAHHPAIVAQAVQLSGEYLSIGSPQVAACLGSVEGMAYLMYLLLRPNHTGVTEDEAFDVLLAVGIDEANRAFKRASGKAAPEGNGSAPPA